jgi:hypothetical protein
MPDAVRATALDLLGFAGLHRECAAHVTVVVAVVVRARNAGVLKPEF